MTETKTRVTNRLLIGIALMALPAVCLIGSSMLQSSETSFASELATWLLFVAIFPGILTFVFGFCMVMFALAQLFGLPRK